MESDGNAIPVHQNVIKNFVNIEFFLADDINKEDCLGWITIMEKCDCDLRTRLKDENLCLEDRKNIAIGTISGYEYLRVIGIDHYDKKPQNILLKDGEAKLIDFGIIEERTGRKSYRETGYARWGSKYGDSNHLCKI